MSPSKTVIVPGTETCGCCEGLEASTPQALANRIGLSAIAYRIGDYAQFKESMLSGLSSADYPALAGLRTRDPDDFTHRVDRRRGLRGRCAHLLPGAPGQRVVPAHRDRAGVAAGDGQAHRLPPASGRGGRDAARIRARSAENAAGRPAARSRHLRDRHSRFADPACGPASAQRARSRRETADLRDGGRDHGAPRMERHAAVDVRAGLARLRRDGDLAAGRAQRPQARRRAAVRRRRVPRPPDHRHALGLPADRFGRRRRCQRPHARHLASDGLVAVSPHVQPVGPAAGARAAQARRGVRRQRAAMGKHEQRVQDQVICNGASDTGEWPVIHYRCPMPVTSTSTRSMPRSGPAASLSSPWRPSAGSVPSGSWRPRRSALSRSASPAPRSRSSSTRSQAPPMYRAPRSRFRPRSRDWSCRARTSTAFFNSPRETSVYVQSEQLHLAPYPVTARSAATSFRSQGRPRTCSPAGGSSSKASARTGGAAARTSGRRLLDAGATLTIAPPLPAALKRDTVVVHANVALATHGETVMQILGAGDASQSFQRFELKRMPLTYRSAATETGADSELSVRVDDVEWTERPTMFGAAPVERAYTLSTDEQGKTFVVFGDGVRGARLPSGVEQCARDLSARHRERRQRRGGEAHAIDDAAARLEERQQPGGGAGRHRSRARRPGAPDDAARHPHAGPRGVAARLRRLRDRVHRRRQGAGAGAAAAGRADDRDHRGRAGRRGAVARQPGVEQPAAGPEGGTAIRTSNVLLLSYQASTFRLGLKVKRDPAYESKPLLAAVEAALRAHYSFASRSLGATGAAVGRDRRRAGGAGRGGGGPGPPLRRHRARGADRPVAADAAARLAHARQRRRGPAGRAADARCRAVRSIWRR